MAKGLTHNVDVVRRAFAKMVLGELPSIVNRAARKVASDVVTATCRGISGGVESVPRRVDTGRYRAAWAMGALKIGQPAKGVSTKGASSSDASTEVKTTRAGTHVGVQNNVEYGPYVELGTERMEPGNHLFRALGVVAQGLPLKELHAELEQEIADAWRAA